MIHEENCLKTDFRSGNRFMLTLKFVCIEMVVGPCPRVIYMHIPGPGIRCILVGFLPTHQFVSIPIF